MSRLSLLVRDFYPMLALLCPFAELKRALSRNFPFISLNRTSVSNHRLTTRPGRLVSLKIVHNTPDRPARSMRCPKCVGPRSCCRSPVTVPFVPPQSPADREAAGEPRTFMLAFTVSRGVRVRIT